MIILRDTVEIKALPERIFEFFVHFKENYYSWHPDHVECRYLNLEGAPKEGSVIYIEEYLHGKLHKLKLHITKVETNSRIEYKTFMGTRGVFIIEPREKSSFFTAEMYMGTNIPLFGSLVDRLIKRQAEGIKRHMAEEGQNLKSILGERE